MKRFNLNFVRSAVGRLLTAALCFCLVSCPNAGGDDVDPFDEFDDFENEMADRVAEMRVADPLAPLNRGVFWFNDKLYFWVLKPVAQGYGKVLPKKTRISVDNFFANLQFPSRFVNNLLQLKWRGAGTELARFTVNSTIGVAGLFDPAEKWWQWRPRDEDFGQTLGHYGVGSIMALQLPLAGPSNVRDALGMIPDYFLNPLNYIEQWEWALAAKSSERMNFLSLRMGIYEGAKDDAVDPYLFFRNAYEQRRHKMIED